MVFYRKYRPQAIEELDSEKVRDKLHSVLAGKSIAHAFLFTGPKGLGKTSTARIVAKVVNCLKRKKDDVNPCNKCDACLSITNGTNLDVLEIDGASNRGIDEIRDLREKARLLPGSSKKKVYIIDEVHMLTTEAFNALLKTIEEPPNHVMFIFCTTEPHKVPATIISRCFHIPFHIATKDEIVHSLERIIKGENITIDKDVLPLIAQMADGGFRDAAKILEETVLLAKEQKITKELFERTYNTVNILSHVYTMLDFLSKKRPKESLKVIADIAEQGTDIKFFIYQVLSVLHRMLLDQVEVEREERGHTYPKNLRFTLEQIQQLANLFNRVYQETKYAVLPQLPLEIAIIEWCSQNTLHEKPVVSIAEGKKVTIDSLIQKQQELKVTQILDPKKADAPKKLESKQKGEQKELQRNADWAVSLLENLIYKTKPYNHSVAALLRSCKITAFDKKTVVIEAGYKFHKERLEEIKTMHVIEKVMKELTGNDVGVKIELKER